MGDATRAAYPQPGFHTLLARVILGVVVCGVPFLAPNFSKLSGEALQHVRLFRCQPCQPQILHGGCFRKRDVRPSWVRPCVRIREFC
jgi:hypothetical protein